MYDKLIRRWLIGLLFFMPFQQTITETVSLWNYDIPDLITYLKYLDEITIIIILPLSLVKLMKEKRSFAQSFNILLLSILLLCFAGTVSGLINGNPLKVTALGIFDYMKNFLAIFIYAAFCNNIMDMKKAFKSLLIVTVFLAAIAIFQEVWAMTSYYVLHKDILDKSIYVLAQNLMPEGSWRFGLYRTPSLMFNPNIFSFFLVLVIVIYKNIKEKVNPAVLLVLVIAVIFTGSRIAYIGLVVFAGMQIFKSRRWVLILSTPAAIVIMIVNLFLYTSDMELKNVWKPDLPEMELTGDVKETKIEDATYISFRQYAKTKGIEIWSDKPFWGVGPGMYGGVVSIKTKSHVYSEYSFFEIAKTYAEKWGGIDQFWPQILAELGVMGTGLFIVFLIFISVILDTARHQATSYEMKCLYSGLIICTTVLIMYSASNGINLSSMILVYTGFIGMALGCEDKALTNASWAEASA